MQLDKERKCEKEAEALFGAIDGENGDGKLSLVELYNAVSANHINWDIAEIKEAMDVMKSAMMSGVAPEKGVLVGLKEKLK